MDVQHGSVRVEDTADGHVLADALTAGERLRYVDDIVQVKAFVPSQAAAWRQGQLIADDQRLAELVQYLPGRVVLRDEALGNKRVTGVYDLSKSEVALHAVIRLHDGEVRSYGPGCWYSVSLENIPALIPK